MITLASILAPRTKDAIHRLLIQLLAASGFPVTAWQSGGAGRVLIASDAEVVSDLDATVTSLAESGLTNTAKGDWLTLRGEHWYNESRTPAQFTKGTILLRDVGFGGPHTVVAGDLTIASSAGRLFTNIDGGTVTLGGEKVLTFQAAEKGTAYNLPDEETFSLVTPLAGVVVGPTTSEGYSTWITQAGSDEEPDPLYAERLSEKWSSLSLGAADAFYDFWAKDASAEVTRTRVFEAEEGTPYQVRLILAGPSGAVSATAVADVNEYFTPTVAGAKTRRPMCVKVSVSSAANRKIVLTGVATAPAGRLSSARSEAEAALASMQATAKIGETVLYSNLIDNMMGEGRLKNLVFTNPPAGTDIVLNDDETPVFDYTQLVWVEETVA